MGEVDKFIAKQVELWGFDHVEELYAIGYEPVETDEGKWSWRLTSDNPNVKSRNLLFR